MSDILIDTLIGYGFGLLAGWWTWGRLRRKLRDTILKTTGEMREIIRGKASE